MEKEKLLDYMFDQNVRLTEQLGGLREEMRLQRDQAEERHREMKARLDRMEERALAAEKRAEMSEKRAEEEASARSRAEEKVEELMKTIGTMKTPTEE